MNEYLIRLRALRANCKKTSPLYAMALPGKYVKRIYIQLLEIKTALDKERPDLFQSYTLMAPANNGDNENYRKDILTDFVNDIDFHIDILDGICSPAMASVSINKQGIFFTGQFYDALMKISEIISEAKNEIIIIDGYVNEKLIDLIKAKNIQAELIIITFKKTNTSALQQLVQAAVKQYGKIRLIENDSFHDRFIIIDQTSFYHFGASLKDAGNKGFMFSAIEEEFLKKSLMTNIKTII